MTDQEARLLSRLRKLVTLAATSPNENEARNAGVEACKMIHASGWLAEADRFPNAPSAEETAARTGGHRYRSNVPRGPTVEEIKRRAAAGERIGGAGARHVGGGKRGADPATRIRDTITEEAGNAARDMVKDMLDKMLRGRR